VAQERSELPKGTGYSLRFIFFACYFFGVALHFR
jgi:hypothetical protein